ncbi:hypothetical protein HPB50_004256 [Hyalomma asiaticum]|uniref:Uncharacterized protein n=1 Tax=Hyalomma asiaticum TaxID=266040 RepID=A0ACB7TC70_HYAAI|nr:hypothetical protein HPB50_004256 [Hyalomma asiaticum]
MIKRRRTTSGPSSTCLFIVLTCVLLPFGTQASPVENYTSTTEQVSMTSTKMSTSPTVPTTTADDEPNYEQVLRNAVARLFASMPSSLRRKLLEADVRPQCSVGMFRLMRGFQNLEPWALKLFDASGKYPSGLLQASKSDLGAFDECLETVVHDSYNQVVAHGEYCSVLFHLKENRALKSRISALDVLHPLIKQYTEYFFIDEIPVTRLGVCIIDDCNKQDLQAIIDAGAWLKCLTSFSALKNTRAVFTVTRQRSAGDFDLGFIHGLRFFSLVSIVLGHSYGIISDAWSRTLNLLILSEHWMSILVTSGFVLVDTFFFISTIGDTVNKYYIIPSYHAMCYFSGCIAYLVADNFRQRKVSKVTLFFAVLMWSYILAYLMYLVCEGPTANLDKLLFSSTARPRDENAAPRTVQKRSNGTQEVVFEIPRIVLENDDKKVANGTQ